MPVPSLPWLVRSQSRGSGGCFREGAALEIAPRREVESLGLPGRKGAERSRAAAPVDTGPEAPDQCDEFGFRLVGDDHFDVCFRQRQTLLSVLPEHGSSTSKEYQKTRKAGHTSDSASQKATHRWPNSQEV